MAKMLSVRVKGMNYVLSNLTDQRIAEFVEDPKKLEEHLEQCIEGGENYVMSDQSLDGIITDTLLSTNKNLTSQRITPHPRRNNALSAYQKRYFPNLLVSATSKNTGSNIANQCARPLVKDPISEKVGLFKQLDGYCSDQSEICENSYIFEETQEEDKNEYQDYVNGIENTASSYKSCVSSKNAQIGTNAVRNLTSAGTKRFVSSTNASVSRATKNPTAKKTKKTKFNEEESQSFDELLIHLVMGQPLIYNYNLATNKSAGLKAEIFQDIFNKIKQEFPGSAIELRDVKNRCNSIRDDFFKRRRKNLQASGASYKEKEIGEFDDMLMDLVDVYDLEREPTISNVASNSLEEDEMAPAKFRRKTNAKKVEDDAIQCIQESTEKFLAAISDMRQDIATRTPHSNTQGDKDLKICERLLMSFRELTDDEKEIAEISILQVFRDIKQNRKNNVQSTFY